MRLTTLALVSFALMSSLSPAQAGTGVDTLFRGGVIEALAPETVLTYAQSRTGPQVDGFHSVEGGAILLTAKAAQPGGSEPSVQMAIEQQGQRREMQEFPASAGNPVLMVFLEDVTRSMAAISGGSPFYIRNRIKDALAKAEAETGADGVKRVVLQPFATDPNAERMGAFAKLTLTIEMQDDLPGYFRLLRAETAPDGFAEEIALKDTP